MMLAVFISLSFTFLFVGALSAKSQRCSSQIGLQILANRTVNLSTAKKHTQVMLSVLRMYFTTNYHNAFIINIICF